MKTRLAYLVKAGIRRATAGQLEEYLLEGELGESVEIVIVTRVELLRFDAIPDSFAIAEGGGDSNAAEFRSGHTKYRESNGTRVSDETQIVTVYFEIDNKKEESPYKPDPVLRLREWGTIHLVAGLLTRSSDLPDDSSEQLSAPSFWSCSKWGLPSH